MICEKYKQISFLTHVQLSLVVCICGGQGGKLPMTWNGQICLIHNFSNLFPLKWLRMTWNGQFCLIGNFANPFPPKWLRMTWNGQFCPIHNFSNFFPLKWLRMTQNSQICPICNFSNRIHVNLGKNNILSVFNLTRRSTRSVLTITT